jgi:hypothetical protein
MKRSCIKQVVVVFVVGCVLLAHVGCEEQLEGAKTAKSGPSGSKPALTELKQGTAAPLPQQQEPVNATSTAQATGSLPALKFEKLMHDFGQVGPMTKNVCEFKFTNTGGSLLKITNVTKTCGCTPFTLAKKQYAPGESGTLKVSFNSGRHPGSATKRLYVSSNDKVRPRIALTIKANIAMKVEYKPDRLNLLLNQENAGCPEITLTSGDNQPFAITSFKSTGDFIIADYDPSAKSTKFVLKPKVDIEKLKKNLNGQIEIGLTHPESKTLTIIFDTLAEFKVNPRVVYVREAEPQKPVTKKVWIFNNYNEDFEIESTSAKKGTIKVLTQEKVTNGYKFELQITPPAAESKRKVFTDVFSVKVKGGQQLQVTCYGIYSKKVAKSPI